MCREIDINRRIHSRAIIRLEREKAAIADEMQILQVQLDTMTTSYDTKKDELIALKARTTAYKAKCEDEKEKMQKSSDEHTQMIEDRMAKHTKDCEKAIADKQAEHVAYIKKIDREHKETLEAYRKQCDDFQENEKKLAVAEIKRIEDLKDATLKEMQDVCDQDVQKYKVWAEKWAADLKVKLADQKDKTAKAVAQLEEEHDEVLILKGRLARHGIADNDDDNDFDQFDEETAQIIEPGQVRLVHIGKAKHNGGGNGEGSGSGSGKVDA